MEKDETLVIIDGTIDKWKDIIFRKGKDDGTDNCPLCDKFFFNDSGDVEKDICEYCPIHIFNHIIGGCGDTPWINWYNSHRDVRRVDRYPMSARNQYEINFANLELSFLYELRLWWINRMNKEVA